MEDECAGNQHRWVGTRKVGRVQRPFGHGDVPGRLHESTEVGDRDGMLVHPEPIDADRMDRSLLGVELVGAHEERAAGDPGHVLCRRLASCSVVRCSESINHCRGPPDDDRRMPAPRGASCEAGEIDGGEGSDSSHIHPVGMMSVIPGSADTGLQRSLEWAKAAAPSRSSAVRPSLPTQSAGRGSTMAQGPDVQSRSNLPIPDGPMPGRSCTTPRTPTSSSRRSSRSGRRKAPRTS